MDKRKSTSLRKHGEVRCLLYWVTDRVPQEYFTASFNVWQFHRLLKYGPLFVKILLSDKITMYLA
jgi:hypothetical protein